MSDRLDPRILFDLIAAHVPEDLHPHILIVGSLAAAYHYRDQIEDDKVNTKDVDVVIQPAGALDECRKIAERLLQHGWRRVTSPERVECSPRKQPTPIDDLRLIRLNPAASDGYFIELLAFPDEGQVEFKKMVPVKLSDGWYCLPSFKFLGLTTHDRQRAANGLAYGSPAMMALANLLSHPTLGLHRIPLGDRSEVLRSAKDLGRVLALARLATRNEVEAWAEQWVSALRATFPSEFRMLAERAGNGLRALLAEPSALEEARYAVDYGLLLGEGVTASQLKALGQQLLLDAIEPLKEI